jgi:hypothetical protein
VILAAEPNAGWLSKSTRYHSVVKRPEFVNTFWKALLLGCPLGANKRSSCNPEFSNFKRPAEAILFLTPYKIFRANPIKSAAHYPTS